jgi:iron complex outermembrane receptor protein
MVRGNSDLEPESGISTDAGIRWAARQKGETRAPWGSLGAFTRWSNALVSYIRSSQGYVEPRNVSSARIAGLELQAGTGFLRWFAAEVSATLLDPRDTTARRLTVNDVLPFQSRLVVAPRVSAEIRRPLVAIGRARAELRWSYMSSRYGDTAGLAVIPEQSTIDAELLATTSDEVWTLRARAVDLLDARRFDVVGFPLPGRSIFLSLEAQW